jgi:hypothetical protein
MRRVPGRRAICDSTATHRRPAPLQSRPAAAFQPEGKR